MPPLQRRRGVSRTQTQFQKNWSASAFAQLYVDLTEQLRLQAGIRYSYEKTTARSTTALSSPCGDPTCIGGPTSASFNDPIIPGSLIVATGKKSWNNVGYKIGLDYKIDPLILVYGYYARGFKSGPKKQP